MKFKNVVDNLNILKLDKIADCLSEYVDKVNSEKISFLDALYELTKLEIANTCPNIDNINVKKLFDRFYREDKSRNKKKEGYGIGLSIAKSIVDMHKGKISAYKKDKDMICFRVII